MHLNVGATSHKIEEEEVKSKSKRKYSEFIQIYTDGAKGPETEETGLVVATPGK